MYMAHDALSNTEMQVSEFDPALLAAAEAQGVIFVAVDAAGDRQIVRACDVTPPSGVEGSFTLVEPVYVDDRMEAVLDVFDAMARAHTARIRHAVGIRGRDRAAARPHRGFRREAYSPARDHQGR